MSGEQKLDKQALLSYFDRPDYYSKIVLNNYMYHQEFFEILKKRLVQEFSNNSFSLLDIGCNDAFIMSEVLKDTTVDYYCGADLAASSLEVAKQNMAKVNCKQEYVCGDFLEEFENSTIKFDVIWTSFMMHHLQSEVKAKFVKLIKSLLKPNGIFMMVDQINDYNSRIEFLDANKENLFKKWTKINHEELTKCIEHCYQCDYPETEARLRSIFLENGFDQFKTINRKEFWGCVEAK